MLLGDDDDHGSTLLMNLFHETEEKIRSGEDVEAAIESLNSIKRLISVSGLGNWKLISKGKLVANQSPSASGHERRARGRGEEEVKLTCDEGNEINRYHSNYKNTMVRVKGIESIKYQD